jgi:uncharacterized phiE125 gp8 family phage protein
MRTHRTQIVTPATLQPLTQAELEAHCRTLGAEGVDVLPYLLAAAEHIETITGRAFLAQTWRGYLDHFPWGDEIQIPKGWLQSVAHLKYWDANDSEYTFPTSQYAVDLGGDGFGRLKLKYARQWPSVTLRTLNPVEVQFVAGKTTAGDLPHAIRQAIRLLGASWYEHREEVVLGSTSAVVSSKLAVGVDALVANWRLY